MRVLDGVVSLFTGLGMQGPSKAASLTAVFAQLPQTQIDAAYRGSWLARALIDMPVDDALGGGRNWQALPEQISALEAEEKRLGWKAKVARAEKWARKDGGAAIFIDAGDDPSKELRPESVGRGSLRALRELHRNELTPGDVVRDVLNPLYGHSETWTITTTQTPLKVHASRLAFFCGDDANDGGILGEADVFGDSLLQSRWDALKWAEAAMSDSVHLIGEANVDVFRIAGLLDKIAGNPDGEQRLLAMMQLTNRVKGNTRALVMNGDEKDGYERKAVSFGALPELNREVQQYATGATGIPATRLFGRAPAGMNSTGDGDERVYFDRLDALREKVAESTALMDECIIRSALGSRPPEVFSLWPSLRQVSDKERAEIGEKLAAKWERLNNLGAYTPDEIRKASSNDLIEAGCAPGLEAAMEETGDDDLGFGEGDEPKPEEEEGAQA